MCGRAYSPNFMFTWPNSRTAVMGGEQAASVLATVQRDGIEGRGGEWSAEEEAAFKVRDSLRLCVKGLYMTVLQLQQPILDKYERESESYYASARLWDDGVIRPADSRQVTAGSVCAKKFLLILFSRSGSGHGFCCLHQTAAPAEWEPRHGLWGVQNVTIIRR